MPESNERDLSKVVGGAALAPPPFFFLFLFYSAYVSKNTSEIGFQQSSDQISIERVSEWVRENLSHTVILCTFFLFYVCQIKHLFYWGIGFLVEIFYLDKRFFLGASNGKTKNRRENIFNIKYNNLFSKSRIKFSKFFFFFSIC